jgi:hypothetical protein
MKLGATTMIFIGFCSAQTHATENHKAIIKDACLTK